MKRRCDTSFKKNKSKQARKELFKTRTITLPPDVVLKSVFNLADTIHAAGHFPIGISELIASYDRDQHIWTPVKTGYPLECIPWKSTNLFFQPSFKMREHELQRVIALRGSSGKCSDGRSIFFQELIWTERDRIGPNISIPLMLPIGRCIYKTHKC